MMYRSSNPGCSYKLHCTHYKFFCVLTRISYYVDACQRIFGVAWCSHVRTLHVLYNELDSVDFFAYLIAGDRILVDIDFKPLLLIITN